MRGTVNSAGSASRPSLLTAQGGTAPPNILDAMGKSTSTPAARSRSGLVWLLVPLVGAAALWLLLPRIQHNANPPVASNLSPKSVAEAARPALAWQAQNSAAVIAATAKTTAQPPVAPPGAVLEVTESAALQPLIPPAQAAQHPLPQPKLTSKVAASPPPRRNPPSAATQTAKARPGPAKTNKDPDVVLLDALIARMGARSSVPSTQTISELVKICQSTDSIEALLCRRRICDGYWGKAQACPADLAPRRRAATRATGVAKSSD